jgi:hypothetical protein
MMLLLLTVDRAVGMLKCLLLLADMVRRRLMLQKKLVVRALVTVLTKGLVRC